LNTRSVVRILGVNGTPTPIPVEQIVAIRRLLEKNLKYDPYPYLAKGIQVEVVKGPLSGVRGIILDKRGKYKLALSVDMLKRAVSVEIDIGDVELL